MFLRSGLELGELGEVGQAEHGVDLVALLVQNGNRFDVVHQFRRCLLHGRDIELLLEVIAQHVCKRGIISFDVRMPGLFLLQLIERFDRAFVWRFRGTTGTGLGAFFRLFHMVKYNTIAVISRKLPRIQNQ